VIEPLSPGDRVPAFTVLEAESRPITSEELWRRGPTALVCYVLDWTGDESG
jgi:hypothetical protein